MEIPAGRSYDKGEYAIRCIDNHVVLKGQGYHRRNINHCIARYPFSDPHWLACCRPLSLTMSDCLQ